MVRGLRIGGISIGFATLFTLSQEATARQAGERLPGIEWAVLTLCALVLVGAILTERLTGEENNLRKDLLWGVGSGGILGVILLTT